MSIRRSHLRDARTALGMCALDLGEVLEVTEQRVYDIERGRYRPKPEEARSWAETLGLPLATAWPELFDAEGGAR